MSKHKTGYINGTKYILGRNSRTVTRLPNFILNFIGKCDARRGKDVADAHVRRYLEKCGAIENLECLAIEAFLKNARSEGAVNLDKIENTSKTISSIPDVIQAQHPWEVLQNRRRVSDKANVVSSVKAAHTRLYEINEQITNGKSILEQRISKIRKKTLTKVAAYVKGVRRGGITSYSPEITFSDIAIEKYFDVHKQLDQAIAKAAAVTV